MLGSWVRTQRERRGYASQAKLADAMSAMGDEAVTAGYVGNLEAGRINIPGQPFLRQLALALGVTEADILRASGVMSPESEVPEEINPFPVEDERWRIVEALKGNDPFVVQACLAVVEHAQRNAGNGQLSVSRPRMGSFT